MPIRTLVDDAAADEIARLYVDGCAINELRRRFRCGHIHVVRVLEARGVVRRPVVVAAYIPTLEDIEQCTAVIRAGWSEKIRKQRAASPTRFSLPVVGCGRRHNGQWVTATRNEG